MPQAVPRPVARASAATLPMQGLRAILLPAVVTSGLWLLRANEVRLGGVACSFSLALLTAVSYFAWRERGSASDTPLLALVCAMIWVSFSFPLFWGSETVIGASGTRYLSQESVGAAMVAAVVASAAMCAGYMLRLSRGPQPQEIFIFKSNTNSHAYLWCLLLGALLASPSIDSLVHRSGDLFKQPIKVAIQFAPLVAFALLVLDYQRKRGTYLDKIGLPLYFSGRTAVGLASGWLGSVVGIGVVTVMAYCMKWRRLPLIPIALIFLVVLFLQPGKQGFRDRYWYVADSATVAERVADWTSESARLWGDAISGQGGAEWKQLGRESIGRLDILHQTANVFEYTPRVVPYQYGRLYSYLLYTWIPRFAWPSKPSMNDANRWYQVAYGLTNDENLEGVSISCGFIAEAYISFGWLGVVLIPFGIGVFLDYLERMLLSRSSGIYFNAVGLALIPQLISIEAQLGQYLAGIVQMIALTTVVLLPVLVWRRKAERRAFAAAARVAAIQRGRVASPAGAGPLSPA